MEDEVPVINENSDADVRNEAVRAVTVCKQRNRHAIYWLKFSIQYAHFEANWLTKSMYFCMASSWLMPTEYS